MTTRKLQTLQNGKVTPIESENEQLDFASIRVGANKLELSQLDASTMTTNGKKLRALDGTHVGDVSTKGQLDTETTARANADNALQDQLNDHEATLDDHETRIDTAEVDINDLQSDVAAIAGNNPKQGRLVVTGGPITTVDLSTFASPFTVDAAHTVLDVELWVNGARWVQCTVGDFSTGGFRKNSTSILETSVPIPDNAEVIVWKQGTSSGGGGGGSDLTAITTDPRPSVSAGQALGTLAKPWSGLYVKDTVTAQVYLIQVVNGSFEALEVP